MLSILNLHVSISDKPILKGLTLTVPAGEVGLCYACGWSFS